MDKNDISPKNKNLLYIPSRTLKQAKVAMGDFANTVESPANQLKVFKQQLVEVLLINI